MDYLVEIENMFAEMQHYEIPTRMLDWTLAPLTALYFACRPNKASFTSAAEKEASDAEVFALNPWAVWKDITAPSSPHPMIMDIMKMERFLMAHGFEYRHIKDYIERKFGYAISSTTELDLPVPFIRRHTNGRIPAQASCLVIWGKEKMALDHFPCYDENIQSAIIPSESKDEIFRQLLRLHINGSTIFPDNKGIKETIDQTNGLYRVI